MTDKQKALFETTIKSVQKDFGINGSQILSENTIVKLPRTSSGSYKIDEAIGGGYPKGRIIEIYGPESSGKTTIALHGVAEAQSEGVAVYIDAEHALDINYARDLGVDIASLVFSQPDTGEQALKIAERWAMSGICSMIVVDSVASMIPQAEMDGEIGDSHVGLLARLMSQGLKKLAQKCYKTGTTLIFINQIREKVGVMFGNPETTSGGRALKFYSSIRLDVRPNTKNIGKNKDGEATNIGTKIKVIKSKVSPPKREVEVDIEFGRGISKEGEILDYGCDLGLIQKGGSWFSYKDNRWQGRTQAKEALSSSPELMAELDALIREMLNPVDVEIEEVEPLPFEKEFSEILMEQEEQDEEQ